MYSKVIQLYIHMCIVFQILLPFRLLYTIQQSSLCCTVGSYWLSLLYWLQNCICKVEIIRGPPLKEQCGIYRSEVLREVPGTTNRGSVEAGYYFNVNMWMAQHSNGTMKPSLPCSCPREAMSSSLSSQGIPSGCLF